MKELPLVAFVVPVHNNKEDTREFLESVKRLSYPNCKVIIIDDGSTDGTEAMLEQEYLEVILLKGGGNLWWAGATNIGIEKAIEIGARYVLLGGMNDTIVDREFISALVETAEKSPRTITVPKVYLHSEPNRIWQAGGVTNWLRGGFRHIGYGETDERQYDEQREVDCATIGILVNATFFKDIGMIDAKHFPLYWGDADFMYRARKAGYKIVYEPKSIIWHKSTSTTKKEERKELSRASLLSKLSYFFTSTRSMYNFSQVIKFYWRHCPKWLIPYALVRLYTMPIASLVVRTIYPKYRQSHGYPSESH